MAVNLFLNIVVSKDTPDGTIKGESVDKVHKDWIEIASYSWGVSVPSDPTQPGSLSGKSVPMGLSITKRLDSASPKLMIACATGTHIDSVTLDIVRAGAAKGANGSPYFTYVFTKVQVSSVINNASGGDDSPTEQVTFVFTQIEEDVRRLAADGGLGPPTKAGYDFSTNKQV